VLAAQAELVARWMLVGFVHGVMNTDNMTISGETIDYGPCAFLDVFDPDAVFSSIDHGGRYRFGHQPQVAQWNLARLAETLLPLIDDDQDTAVAAVTEVLATFPERFHRAWSAGMQAKLGLAGASLTDEALADDLLALMRDEHADPTAFFRALSAAALEDEAPVRAHVLDRARFDTWAARWHAELSAQGADPQATAAAMNRVNPVYIPRNHLVEEALSAATAGDLAPFEQLLDAVSRPFDERPGLERYAEAAPSSFGPYRTFCGT
jgi:serine/tyrosine/threonine adenylyltransferase